MKDREEIVFRIPSHSIPWNELCSHVQRLNAKPVTYKGRTYKARTVMFVQMYCKKVPGPMTIVLGHKPKGFQVSGIDVYDTTDMISKLVRRRIKV